MSEPEGGTATFVQRRNHRLREAMAFLGSRPDGADKTEIEFHVASAVPPTPDDLELNSSGVLKWLTAFHWYSTAFTRSGWLIKDGAGHWAITDAGREALKEHLIRRTSTPRHRICMRSGMRRTRPRDRGHG